MAQASRPPEGPGENIAESLKNWAIERALPLWASHGYDKTRGGFQERLHADGRPDLKAPRRLRVQARQIYVYAHAASLGWFPPGRALVLSGLDFLDDKYRRADGRPGYVFSIAADGTPADTLRSTYDHMFVLLALAWATQATGDAQLRRLIDDVIAFIDDHLTARDGSYLEGAPPSLPRRQNPHMHAFEAMLAWHECTGDARALPRARALLTLMQEKFLDRERATIGEYFTDDWQPAPGPAGDAVEPGHLAEWAALLRRHERLTGAAPQPLAGALLSAAARFADAGTGLLPDEASRGGSTSRASHRLWPQTELARAWLGEAEIGRPDAAANAQASLQAIADRYLDGPLPGGWHEQLDANGKPIAGFIPATSLYHLFGVIAEADRVRSTTR